MNTFEPPKQADYHFLFIAFIFATIIGWAFLTLLRPMVIDTGCSEIAERSSSIFVKRQKSYFENYDFDYLKAKCMDEALAKKE